jgi:uncharacterized membrane protein required for colicin V production
MEIVERLSWIDLLLIIVLAAGIFLGFVQGAVRYVLNCLAVLLAFVIAAQLKGPISGGLSFWTAFSDPMRDLFFFLVIFFAIVIAAWAVALTFHRRAEVGLARQLDDLAGAVLGLVFVVLLLVFHLMVLDSFFRSGLSDSELDSAGFLRGYYDGLNSSFIVELLRTWVLPLAAMLVRPFVPADVASALD